jgi:hypothetical protein
LVTWSKVMDMDRQCYRSSPGSVSGVAVTEWLQI